MIAYSRKYEVTTMRRDLYIGGAFLVVALVLGCGSMMVDEKAEKAAVETTGVQKRSGTYLNG